MNESIENVSKEEFWSKIKGFMDRWEKNPTDDAIDFLQYLVEYPESMCKSDMSPTLKREIAKKYFWGIEKVLCDHRGVKNPSKLDLKPYYDFEDISVMFDRSKSSIHEATKEYAYVQAEMKKKCEDEAEYSRHLQPIWNRINKELGRSIGWTELHQILKDRCIDVMHDAETRERTESEEYAEFLEWRKVQRIKEQ